MKTLKYFAALSISIIFFVSFNSSSYGSLQIADCLYCDSECTESECCDDQENTSQGNSFDCGYECTNEKCKESCSAGSSSAEKVITNNNDKSSVVNTELSCPDKNNSGNESKDCCK